MKKQLATAITCAMLFTGLANASELTDKAIEFRKANFTVMSWNMGIMAGMAKGEIPYDAAQAESAAKHLLANAEMIKEGYIADSYTGDTRVKPEIETNRAEFDEHADKLVAEAEKMVSLAGDEGTMKKQLGAIGKTCKGCHDQFRND